MGWTAADLGDLTGLTAVVTGANSGLGFEATKQLVLHGATVIAGCRSLERGQVCLALPGPGSVDVRRLDLADLGSIADFAAGVVADYPTIDIGLNNAGVMAIPRTETADGFEMQLGTNHLGHFALTGRLLPSLLAAPAARIVSVSSGMHKVGRMDFTDLMGERKYQRWQAYSQSKLANLLFTYELQARLAGAGAAAIAVAAHPGYAATNLQSGHARATGRGLEERLMSVTNKIVAQSAADGALPELYAATAPGVMGGDYFGPSRLFESRGAPKLVQPTAAAKDPVSAARLWAESVRLTGVTYAELDRM
ncbi:MAG: SDR family NAD(P)-dependent oxidoreductase [Actinobacteria bacterium]|nr:MAG: SDR family NAD(P)-dependent oxidoreductase [Actinomycetota bacterium]